MPEELIWENLSSPLLEAYEIRLRGLLDPDWADWLDCQDVVHTPDGDTILACLLVDQTALHGLLAKIRDMNLVLLSVTRVETPDDRPKDSRRKT